MSTSIVSRVISSLEDKRLVLANSRAARTMGVLDSWTQLRIGVRISAKNPSASSIGGTPALVIGVLSGTANQFGNTADHFLGVKTIRTTWTYNAGPPAYHYDGAGNSVEIHKVESGTPTSGNVLSSVWGTPIASENVRWGFFFDIKKDTTWQIKGTRPGAPSALQSDWSEDDLLAAMELADLSSISTVKANNTDTGWINCPAIDEATYGSLNSIQVYWDKATTEIEFSDVRYRVVA